jgi:hypothetical protein
VTYQLFSDFLGIGQMCCDTREYSRIVEVFCEIIYFPSRFLTNSAFPIGLMHAESHDSSVGSDGLWARQPGFDSQ